MNYQQGGYNNQNQSSLKIKNIKATLNDLKGDKSNFNVYAKIVVGSQTIFTDVQHGCGQYPHFNNVYNINTNNLNHNSVLEIHFYDKDEFGGDIHLCEHKVMVNQLKNSSFFNNALFKNGNNKGGVSFETEVFVPKNYKVVIRNLNAYVMDLKGDASNFNVYAVVRVGDKSIKTRTHNGCGMYPTYHDEIVINSIRSEDYTDVEIAFYDQDEFGGDILVGKTNTNLGQIRNSNNTQFQLIHGGNVKGQVNAQFILEDMNKDKGCIIY